jgi:micrococcal nuclease
MIRMNKTCKILPVLILTFLILPSLLFAGQYKVVRVVDGDTVVITYQGKLEKVRMLCVNTPESVHPDKKQNIPMGKTASNYTKKRLQGRYVDLEFEGPLRGGYGRLLSYLILDGENFNLELVRQGLSPYYTKYGLSKKYDQDFKNAERYARNHKLHIWGDTDLAQKYLRLKSKWGQYRSKTSSPTRIVQTKEWSYVASRKSKVFHRADAKCVKTISPHNLIGFKSREEAIASGWRPCNACRP